jgi:hypothetical protein
MAGTPSASRLFLLIHGLQMTFQVLTDNPEPVVFPKDRTRALVQVVIAERAPAVTFEQVMKFRCRHARVVAVRALVWRVMKFEWGWSYPRIAQMFGCHHTTVLHGIRKSDADIEAGLVCLPDGPARTHAPQPPAFSEMRRKLRLERRRNRHAVRFLDVRAGREGRTVQ